ncbi:MAG: hypothetical protein HOC66_00365, partial [Flavobacteriales bacterium]|nr:hypothetical protein [Flavobacteriales bacterium]
MDYNIVIKYILINDVMKKLLLVFILFLGVLSAQAEPEYGTVIVSKVISVYDG